MCLCVIPTVLFSNTVFWVYKYINRYLNVRFLFQWLFSLTSCPWRLQGSFAPGFVRNQRLSLLFRKEHVEKGQGDVSCGYIERNHTELSRTRKSQGCCLVCNIIKIQLSRLFSLCFLSETVKETVSLLMKSWGLGVTGISRLEGCFHTENAWLAIFPILVDRSF